MNLLTENRDKLEIVANALLEREVLEREELLDVMGMNPDKPIDAPEAAMADAFEDIDREDISKADDPFALFTEEDDDSPEVSPPADDGDDHQPEQNQ